MRRLSEIQQQFASALVDPHSPVPDSLNESLPTRSARRFNVYRNNRVVNTVEVIRSNFPAVARLVGDDYFNAVARDFINRHPPRQPVLLRYGERFADFLDSQASTARYPYLGDVARLEWTRIDTVHTRDAETCSLKRLACIPGHSLGELTIVLHPAVRLLRSRWPVLSLWRAALDPEAAPAVDMDRAEAVMLVRPRLEVQAHVIDACQWTFTRSLAQGASLGGAARRAVDESAEFDLATAVRLIFEAGAVQAIDHVEQC